MSLIIQNLKFSIQNYLYFCPRFKAQMAEVVGAHG
jgi:hypothetical protein